MCYSVAFLAKRAAYYTEKYNKITAGKTVSLLSAEWPMHYFVSGFDHPKLPLLTSEGVLFANWGLIPSWTKDEPTAGEVQNQTLNARSETIFEKTSFKESIQRKRGILLVNGFFEWRFIYKSRYPYFIQSAQNDQLALACVYDSWLEPSSGKTKETFSILTTEANLLMKEIHNQKQRMPLILKPEDELLWLDRNLDKSDIEALMQPFPDSFLKAYTVSKAIGNAKGNRNSPNAIEKVTYPELNYVQGTLF